MITPEQWTEIERVRVKHGCDCDAPPWSDEEGNVLLVHPTSCAGGPANYLIVGPRASTLTIPFTGEWAVVSRSDPREIEAQ